MQDFGEHGREFITSEVGLKLLTVLGDPQQLSQLVGGGRRAERLQAILQHCVLKVGAAAAAGKNCFCCCQEVEHTQFRTTTCIGIAPAADRCTRAIIPARQQTQKQTLVRANFPCLPSSPLPACQVLPMENVAGRDIVEGGNLCERKNGRGVDPNRNWDIDWGVKEKDYDPKEEYPGTAALR